MFCQRRCKLPLQGTAKLLLLERCVRFGAGCMQVSCRCRVSLQGASARRCLTALLAGLRELRLAAPRGHLKAPLLGASLVTLKF